MKLHLLVIALLSVPDGQTFEAEGFSNRCEVREDIDYVRSFDGMVWDRVGQLINSGSREIQQDGRIFRGPSDVTTFCYVPVSGRFIGSLRFANCEGVGAGNKNPLLAKAIVWLDRMDEPLDSKKIERLDRVPAGAATNGDLPNDESTVSA